MMGKRGRTNQDEHDAFSRWWRRQLRWRPGELKQIKRAFAKKVRQSVRRSILKDPDADRT